MNTRLTGQSVALIVKNAVALLGDPQRFPAANYAGHSLRAGFATQAAAAGVPLDRIMDRPATTASPSPCATSAKPTSGKTTPARPRVVTVVPD